MSPQEILPMSRTLLVEILLALGGVEPGRIMQFPRPDRSDYVMKSETPASVSEYSSALPWIPSAAQD